MKPLLLSSIILFSASIYATPKPSSSEIRVGFENVGYSESLANH